MLKVRISNFKTWGKKHRAVEIGNESTEKNKILKKRKRKKNCLKV